MALALAIVACRDGPTTPSTPIEMFDEFWATFDREYSYFAYKGINWDSLRAVYRPNAVAAPSETELIPILKQMVAPLRDLHVWFVRPDGRFDMTHASNGVVNWDAFVWTRLTDTCGLVYARRELGHCTMFSLGYVFIKSWNDHNFTVADLDAVIDRYRDAPGIIIDVRPNGGGLDQLGLALAGRFAANQTTIGSVQYRNGPDHDDFGEQIVRRVSPRGAFRFLKPVIVLAGRGSYSSTETFVSAMRELPSVTILGDTTGGSSGNPAQHRLGAWQYSVPSWIERTADRRVIEWNGIPPDVFVPWTQSEVSSGRDPVLSAALARLRN
jgi:hypothetical protein